MKGKPIHQNLSTSFVDLPALVRHLRGLQFAGSIRLEFSSYEAEIIFTGTGGLHAREYDKLVGRIGQGEKAYRRILSRSREPHGRVHVIQAATKESVAHLRKPFVDERIVAEARRVAFGCGDRLARVCSVTLRPIDSLPQNQNIETVKLATELLLTVKDAFAKLRLDFDRAFARSCKAAAKDFTFLNIDAGHFAFLNDEIQVSESVANGELFAGIVEALRQLFGRMRVQPRFAKLLAFARHRIQQHLSSRHDEYERLEFTEKVDRLFI